MAKIIRLGITGGIGSGKSVVSRLLNTFQIPVYDSDSISKYLTVSDSSIRSGLVSLLGSEVYDAAGNLNKQLLGSYLFSSDEHAAQVNAIIHPVLKKHFNQWVKEQSDMGHAICCIESAILIDAGFLDVIDKVLVVTAPAEMRINRVIRRDHVSRQTVESRMDRQMSEDERIRLADFVVENDGRHHLIPQVSTIISSLLKK